MALSLNYCGGGKPQLFELQPLFEGTQELDFLFATHNPPAINKIGPTHQNMSDKNAKEDNEMPAPRRVKRGNEQHAAQANPVRINALRLIFFMLATRIMRMSLKV